MNDIYTQLHTVEENLKSMRDKAQSDFDRTGSPVLRGKVIAYDTAAEYIHDLLLLNEQEAETLFVHRL